MKQIANIITLSRIAFALAMILAVPFSALFWLCYFLAGLSDIADGYAARKLNQQSAMGAKLDSIADLAFAVAILIVVVKNIDVPGWLWLCAAIIAALRVISYGVGFSKYHTFSSLHTTLNKATGALIYAFPLLYVLLGMTAAGAVVSFAALVSAVEELAITVRSKELDRDRKGLIK